MEIYRNLIILIAGICFFMYGMRLASDNLQILAADRVRQFMSKIARHQLVGILSGTALTVLLQSSSAVTVMLVNLASAGVVTLEQVMGVIIGSTIGTTVTVQLISFHVTSAAVYFVILGFAILFFSKRKKTTNVGNIIFGFGLIFYGLLMMGDAIAFIKDDQSFRGVFTFLNGNPWLALLGTAIFSAAVQSSAVVVGLAMTLATNGVLSGHDSLYWVYGANVGTTATALIASLSCNYLGRQVAWAHLIYKFATVLGFVFVTEYFAEFIKLTSDSVSHQIANAHSLIAIIGAIVFYPFISWGARLIQRLFPRPLSEREFGPKYLDLKALSEPPLAFSNAVREMMRMSEFALEMVRISPRAFEKDDPNFVSELTQIDQKVDVLNREIKMYLIKLTDATLTPSQNARVVSFIALVTDIEHIGDVIDKNVLDLARKKSNLKINFSQEGWSEVKDFHRRVVENFELAISAFSLQNKELAEKVIENKHDLRLLEQKLKGTHIQRLHRKLQDSLNTSNIHLELLSSYRRINSYACNLVYPIIFAEADGLFPADDTKIPVKIQR